MGNFLLPQTLLWLLEFDASGVLENSTILEGNVNNSLINIEKGRNVVSQNFFVTLICFVLNS